MKQQIISAISAILIVFATVANSFGQEVHSPRNKTIQLFNGKDLTGWYTFIEDRGRNTDPKNVFTVQNGMIRVSGEEWGCITTENEYENYHIVLEFKWGEETHPPRKERARDSGLLLHSQGEDGSSGGIWMHSIECQMIEGGTGDIIVVGDGSNNFSVTATVAPEKQGNSFVYQPGGEKQTINSGRLNWIGRATDWNKLECVAENDQLTIFLNGKLINKAIRVKPQKGKIQIQSEAAEVFVRKVELLPL
jgi:hypothetical protein